MSKRTKPGLPVGKAYERFTDQEKEVMQRLLEGQQAESIMRDLGLEKRQYDSIVTAPTFSYEFTYLSKHRDRKLDKRLENLSQEALDVVRYVMRNATSEAYRLRAALEILDRSGHVKVEKRLQINADAEAIIKHLNTLGTQPAQVTIDAEVIPNDAIESAVTQTLEATEVPSD